MNTNRNIKNTILFTAAIAAVNNHLIAQPKNNRLDSLKRECSYEICRQYCNIENPLIFPICKVFPEYFRTKQSEYILPNYWLFSYEYASPAKADWINRNRDGAVVRKRKTADSILKEIYYHILLENHEYRKTMQQIRQNPTNDSLYMVLAKIELDIKTNNTQYYTVTTNQWTNPRNHKLLRKKVFIPDTYSTLSWSYTVQVDPMLPMGFKTEWRSSYYYDPYVAALQQANLASLRVILDDHIRRGVPIDISWIPEQTLAEIETTKPVRQLKKQIKALEKQQKQ